MRGRAIPRLRFGLRIPEMYFPIHGAAYEMMGPHGRPSVLNEYREDMVTRKIRRHSPEFEGLPRIENGGPFSAPLSPNLRK